MHRIILSFLLMLGMFSPATAFPSTVQHGIASYYGAGFNGRRTASGERFNQFGFTAAHPFYKFGTRLKVTNKINNKSVIVRVTDRGNFAKLGRIIDLSQGAAQAIGMVNSGVAPVKVEVLRR